MEGWIDHPSDGSGVGGDAGDAAAAIAGHLNVLNASLVALMARVLADDDWQGQGIHSPAQWLAWKTGVSPERARDVVRVAQRRASFPRLMEAFDRGELSLEQVAVAVRAPSWADEYIIDFARLGTVAQLRRKIRSEEFVGDPDEPDPEPSPDERDRLSTRVTDDHRWRISGVAGLDRGAIVDAALGQARESLFERGQTQISGMDCLAEVCERYLDGIDSPLRRDRSKTWLHLDVTDGEATTTDGWRIPMSVRDQLLCDGVVQPVWERDGRPFSVGRTQRIVPERTRRYVSRRDRGCRVPGCSHDRFVEIHHVLHWLEGGTTDTWNLVAVCPKHHRLHHQGKLGISGNADEVDGVVFTDWRGRVIEPVGTPVVPTGPPPRPEVPYRHPYGGRLDYDWIGISWVHPNELRRRRNRWRTEPPAA